MRRLAPAVLGIALWLAIVPAGAAAASTRSNRAVHTRFGTLRFELHRTHGLSSPTRKHLLVTARRAERTVDRRPCGALAILEDLRKAIRSSKARHTASVDGVEVAIIRTKRGSRCGFLTRRVTLRPEQFGVGGPIQHIKRPRRTPGEASAAPTLVSPTVRRPHPGPPTNVVPISPGAAFATGSSPFAFSTIGSVRAHVDLFPEEPSEASAGRVVWITGNSGAAFSTDGGATFTRIDPRDLFPEVKDAFCCDQVVVYAPRINRFIWLIQYWCEKRDARCNQRRSSNMDRLVVASPQDIIKNHGELWTSYAIRPRNLGRRHNWSDYPDLGLGAHSLYITSNLFRGSDGDGGAFVARVSLSELKAARAITLHYHVDPNGFSYKPVQGAGSRGFLFEHDTDTRLRTLSWDEGSPLLLEHPTRHSIDASLNYESLTGAGSVDWGDRTDDRITGATRRGNELWVAWSEGRSICTAKCDGASPHFEQIWPQPHVHVVVVDATSFRLVRERFIHNPNYAISYPSLATDSLGRVGMSFSYGGGMAGNASPAGGYLTGVEEFRQVARSLVAGEQGDFLSIRPDWPNGSRFTGSGYVSDADHPDGSQELSWLFYRYSR